MVDLGIGAAIARGGTAIRSIALNPMGFFAGDSEFEKTTKVHLPLQVCAIISEATYRDEEDRTVRECVQEFLDSNDLVGTAGSCFRVLEDEDLGFDFRAFLLTDDVHWVITVRGCADKAQNYAAWFALPDHDVGGLPKKMSEVEQSWRARHRYTNEKLVLTGHSYGGLILVKLREFTGDFTDVPAVVFMTPYVDPQPDVYHYRFSHDVVSELGNKHFYVTVKQPSLSFIDAHSMDGILEKLVETREHYTEKYFPPYSEWDPKNPGKIGESEPPVPENPSKAVPAAEEEAKE